jgi:flagellar biosynthesis protein FlhF
MGLTWESEDMKIKRFIAPDIRQAMRMVREELGGDAVILTNKRVEEGVEIVAAVDYDATILAARDGSGVRAEEARADGRDVRDKANIAERRPNVPAVEPKVPATNAESKAKHPTAVSGVECASKTAIPDPVIAEMRAELERLRRMLEHQLSGLAWGSFARGGSRKVELIERLMRLGLTGTLCRSLGEAEEEGDLEAMWGRALERLVREVPIYDRDLLDDGGVIALVGPTGVGKTTTIAKLAARFALRHGSRNVALVTIDNYRVGAHEQLKIYGRIIDAPVRVAKGAEDLRATLAELADRRLVLIDTTGMSHRDRGLLEQVSTLESCRPARKIFLLLSAASRYSALEEVVSAFRPFGLDGCILTKVDESTCLGGGLSVAIKYRLPVAYLSDGQRVPEDLQPARADRLVERAVETMNRSTEALNEDLVALAFGKELADVH